MISITNAQAYEVLMTITQTQETGLLGYALAKNRRRIEAELATYLETRQEIINKYAVDGEEGRYIPEDRLMDANAELLPFNALPCEFEPYTVSPEVFTGGGLTSEQMYTLDFMVKEDDDHGQADVS